MQDLVLNRFTKRKKQMRIEYIIYQSERKSQF